MTRIFNGIAEAAQSAFGILPSLGAFTNWFFGIVIAVGVVYWVWYDAKVRRGGKNYLANKG